MKICMVCQVQFLSEDGRCPVCGLKPEQGNRGIA